MSDSTHSDNQHAHHLLSEHVRKNRAMWEASSDSYEQRHALALSGEKAMAWGMWRIPEEELLVLGDVTGKDILELGCGAARCLLRSLNVAHDRLVLISPQSNSSMHEG